MENYTAFKDLVSGTSKRFTDWSKTIESKEIVSKLSRDLNCPSRSSDRSSSALILDLTGRGNGIYVRNEIAPYIEQWIAKKSPCKPNYLYLIRCKQTSRYKIGITNDIAQRVRTIETHSPLPVKVECCVKHDRASELEKIIHQKYASSRVHGEWFDFGRLTKDSVLSDFQNLNALLH